MKSNALVQIMVIVVAVIIVAVFVRPMFSEIGLLQDEIFEYQDAVAKANEFNTRLEELIAVENSFSFRDVNALETFLPVEIDSVRVLSDLGTIASSTSMAVDSFDVDELYTPSEQTVFAASDEAEQETLAHQDFNISVFGSYTQAKEFMRALERNAYPLEMVEFSIGPLDESEEFAPDTVTMSLILRTYALVE